MQCKIKKNFLNAARQYELDFKQDNLLAIWGEKFVHISSRSIRDNN
jgi:hypothetical protein